jgi:hypothetical protein
VRDSLAAVFSNVPERPTAEPTALAGTAGESVGAPRIARGAVLWYRLFDVCNAVELPEAQRLLLRSRVDRASIQFRQAPRRELGAFTSAATPLIVELGMLETTHAGQPLLGTASIKIFDHGTLSFTFEVAVREERGLDELARLAAELADSAALTHLAREQFETVIGKIDGALSGKHDWGQGHSYAVVFAEQPVALDVAAAARTWVDLPKLVACELDSRAVSAEQRQDVLRYTDAYLEDDLVVVGTSAALVIEPSGSREVPNMLELALAQMQQLRFYDEELDRELAQAYRDFGRRRAVLALYSPFGDDTRRLSRRLVELTEFTERIDNALKIVSDLYLARVYRKAVHRFAIPTLKERVTHKHELVMRIYGVLRDEVQMMRSFGLELMILVLILIEVVFAISGH